MPPRPFPHLPLPLRFRGSALIHGGGKQARQTEANRSNFAGHAAMLRGSAAAASESWRQQQAVRQLSASPVALGGMPVLLRVDPNLDLDVLREKFDFEIVSEQEDGFVIVASEDIQLTALLDMIDAFSTDTRGSATVASIHQLFDDPSQDERLKRILSDTLYATWPTIADDQAYVCDLGVGCLGAREIPDYPKRRTRDTDSDWARKVADWSGVRAHAYQAWDEIKFQREEQIVRLISVYGGRIINVIDGAPVDSVRLPDSFTVRVEVSGRGLRDLVLNSPYLFEVVESEEVELPQSAEQVDVQPDDQAVPVPPPADAPTVCVIDSGVQEEHRLLSPAIERGASHCFLPGSPADRVSDYVQPGGHGTRVAGAILYGEDVPRSGQPILELWVQNARVLDDRCSMPSELFPPAAIRAVVERYNAGTKPTRIFNQSINSKGPCRTRHMSAWAAEIDVLSEQRDILVVQSAGNLYTSAPLPQPGVRELLAAGREYPAYLDEPVCRVANPAQSLQALTVGSVAYGAFDDEGWRSFAAEQGHPSAFSRSGFGMWGVIKPEVVEFGGDYLRTAGSSASVGTPTHARDCYPDLVRSTMYPAGPATDRDEVGTSFAAPKVTRIAAKLQQALPEGSCLLYRALVVQSARWPEWARTAPASEQFSILRRIGYGIPDIGRASTNTDHRTTLIASADPQAPEQDLRIRAGECHMFQVPIPEGMRRPGTDYDILIEVTLSYVAQPRRTRRNLRRYLSTWVDWKSSKLREPIERFRVRAMKDQNEERDLANGTPIPWMLDTKSGCGVVRGVKRSAGTVQKDWAIVKSNQLPDDFCVAIVGHKGWSRDPDSSARYALAVSFEVIGQEVPIYEDVRVAVERLRVEIEAETEVDAAS